MSRLAVVAKQTCDVFDQHGVSPSTKQHQFLLLFLGQRIVCSYEFLVTLGETPSTSTNKDSQKLGSRVRFLGIVWIYPPPRIPVANEGF